MNPEIARTPAQIASEINAIKQNTDRMMLYDSIEIGRRLTEAKALVPYGEWGRWLQESVSYSQRTANYLQQIYKEFGPALSSPDAEENPDSQPVANLGFTKAVILLGIPIEERAQFMACNDVGNMTKRELQQAVAEAQQPKEPQKTAQTEDQAKDKTAEQPTSSDQGQASTPIPVEYRIRRVRRSQPVATGSAGIASADIIKYEAEFAKHRDDILNAYQELLKTLVSLDRTDPMRKEIHRTEAFKIATNMAATLKKYPPSIKTNLEIKEFRMPVPEIEHGSECQMSSP